MRSHMDAVMDLQADLVGGRLAHAREMAAWLAQHDTRFDPLETRDGELQHAAEAIAKAPDLASAAAGVGRLGRACGSCHQAHAANVDAFFVQTRLPAAQPTLEAQMARHAWAARRLWEGVVTPSNSAWLAGAQIMVTSSIDLTRTTNAKPNERVVELSEEMRAFATRALDMSDHDARASLYGEMLVTCVQCHSIVRPNAVSAP